MPQLYRAGLGLPPNLTSHLALAPDTRCALQEDKSSQGILLDEKSQELPKNKERAQTARH
jgi:hypothetical protein